MVWSSHERTIWWRLRVVTCTYSVVAPLCRHVNLLCASSGVSSHGLSLWRLLCVVTCTYFVSSRVLTLLCLRIVTCTYSAIFACRHVHLLGGVCMSSRALTLRCVRIVTCTYSVAALLTRCALAAGRWDRRRRTDTERSWDRRTADTWSHRGSDTADTRPDSA